MGSILREYPDKVIIVGGKKIVTGDKTLRIEPIACKDYNQDVDLYTREDINVDISTNGLNGLDTGTVQNSTTYYLYIVRSKKFLNDLPVGFLFSLSDTAPTFTDDNDLKSYDLYRRVGTFRISASGNIEEQDLLLVIKGIVDTYAELPVTPDDILDIWIVRNGSGIYLINRKPGGLYRWDVGLSSWVFMAETTTFFNSGNFEIYDNADNTKRLKFIISAISTSTIRTITMPNRSVDLGYVLKHIDYYSFASGASPYLSTNSTSYIVMASFIFPGTDIVKALSKIKIIGNAPGTSTWSARIYDYTHAQIIATVTGQTNITKAIINMGTISNVPTGESIFEIQMLKSVGTGSAELYALSLEYG